MGETVATVLAEVRDDRYGYSYEFSFEVYENYDTNLRVLTGTMRVNGGSFEQITLSELQVMALVLREFEEAA